MRTATTLLLTLLLAWAAPRLARADRVTPAERVREYIVVRQTPVTWAASVGKLNKGESAKLAATSRYWHQVTLDDGTIGFVSRAWTEVVPEVVATNNANRITVTRVATVAQVPTGRPAAGHFRVHLIDVGTGLAVLVLGSDFTLLYDGGSRDDKRGFSGSSNKSRLLAYLYAAIGPSGAAKCKPQGDSWASAGGTELTIDHLFLSHQHEDHGNLLDEALACYSVTNIWEPGVVNDTVFYGDYLKAVAAEKGATYHTVAPVPANRTVKVKGEKIKLPASVIWEPIEGEGKALALGAGATFTILHADAEEHSDPNENSLVIVLDLGGVRLLLTGDAESGEREDPSADVGDIEEHLLTTHATAIKADILQVGHHDRCPPAAWRS